MKNSQNQIIRGIIIAKFPSYHVLSIDHKQAFARKLFT
ncbi:hypothetical protein T01_9510 [Trichinella spiralis]|uniref:Uncharacterized protein n=1 Tax=Trichinella spiralis TaxID=6334 RepID=A0A0V0YSY2_TRISP|nr:hypothetical protein T01_9510 [Trichinella spiralis]